MEQYYVRLRNQGNNLVTIHLDPIEVLLESTSPYLGIHSSALLHSSSSGPMPLSSSHLSSRNLVM